MQLKQIYWMCMVSVTTLEHLLIPSISVCDDTEDQQVVGFSLHNYNHIQTSDRRIWRSVSCGGRVA